MIRIGLGGCLALAIALGSAGQASADQYDFISELDSAGVSYPSTSEMIGIGKAVCHDLRLGLPVETALWIGGAGAERTDSHGAQDALMVRHAARGTVGRNGHEGSPWT